MTVRSQTPQRFLGTLCSLAGSFMQPTQSTQPAHLESFFFFCAEHGQRIHELHMARSTLVQLDSIDRVSSQSLRCTTGSPCGSNPDFDVVCAMVWVLLCLSMLGRPLPTMIFETFWPMEKTKMRTVAPTRRGSSTAYFTVAKPLSGQWMKRSGRLQKKKSDSAPASFSSRQAQDLPRQLPGPCPVAGPPTRNSVPLETETNTSVKRWSLQARRRRAKMEATEFSFFSNCPAPVSKQGSLTSSSALLLVWKSDEVKHKGGSFSARLVVGIWRDQRK